MSAGKSMSHDDVRELAGHLMDRGLYVFPTLHKRGDPNDKKPPPGGRGFHDATNDPDRFEELLRPVRIGSGWHLGVGVHPGRSGYIVLDPDVKDGGRGLESLDWIESVYGELPGRRVRSPSGGLHVWMKLPDGYTGEIGNKKVNDWPDVDVRCHNGYVIAPGVTVPWGGWTVEGGEIGEIPEGVLTEIENARNEPKAIAAEVTPGDRHDSIMSVVASMWARGLTRESVLLAARSFNEAQVKPPKPDREIVEMVDWIVTKEGGPQPDVILPDTGQREDEPVDEGPLPFLTLAELAAKVDAAGPRRYLIRGIWPSGQYGVHAGEMKAQKTWNVADLAVSVASGTPWFGHFEIDDPGPVVLFAGEGGEASLVRRLRAVATGRGLQAEDLDIHVCTRAPHLRKDDHMAVFAGKVSAIRPKLVVLDPLYLSAGGAKGGDLYGMGELLERPQIVCDQAGASLVVVTHFNRGNKTGANRITGAGPAEWGRVLVNADVKSRHTDAETKATTVVTVLDVIGGEVPDTEFRIRRDIVADDPDDLDSPLAYKVTVIDEETDAGDEDMPPARRKLLEAVNAVGGSDGATNSQLVDWIADKYGHGLYRTTVSAQLNELARAGLVDSIESPGNPTLWLPSEGVAGVAATPTRHPATGETERVSSSSSRLKDDDTPTPQNTPLDLSPDDTYEAETERIAP